MTERIDAKEYASVVRKKNKYGAKKVVTEEGTFDSKKEYARWCELKLLEKARDIKKLSHHELFPLEVSGKLIKTYEADFTYFDHRTMRWTIEDSKGVHTPEWRITKKLLQALLPSWIIVES